jgi:hypothetical protein
MMTPAGVTTLGTGIDLPLPVLAIALGTLAAMIYIALHDDDDPRPTVSPD